jgi:uncharacterized membrane protein
MVYKKPETAVIPNWHESHSETLSLGDRIADKVAAFIGSWEFIILQSFILWVWALGNIYALFHFDRKRSAAALLPLRPPTCSEPR